MSARILWAAAVAAALVLGGLAAGCKSESQPAKPSAAPTAPAAPAAAEAATYTCPMHPEVKSDKPGTCPKCGMALVPVKEAK